MKALLLLQRANRSAVFIYFMIIVFGCYWSVNGDPFNHFYTAKAYSQQKI